MPIGIVEFFNRSRGFGRIRVDHIPEGVFVHFSDVSDKAKILLPNELVEFSVAETKKGPKATKVDRFGRRFCGLIDHYDKGFGRIRSRKGKAYFFHHSDVLGRGFKYIANAFEVEFSPFEGEGGWQAKEIVITDTRPPLEKFARLVYWKKQLQQLADLAKEEKWKVEDESRSHHPFPLLENYLYHTFSRLREENKVVFTRDEQGRALAAFHTGLLTTQEEEISAFFQPNKRKDRNRGYIKMPRWELLGFGQESHRWMSHFSAKPPLASFTKDPCSLIFDPQRRLIVDFDHILEDHEERFPDNFLSLNREDRAIRLRQAIEKARFRVSRNYRVAIPQYYHGQVQLLLPLTLDEGGEVDLALVVGKEYEVYRANTVIPLDWAYQNARLIAPLEEAWLLKSCKQSSGA